MGIYRPVRIDAVDIEVDIRLALRHVAKGPVYLDFVGDVGILGQMQGYYRDSIGFDNGHIGVNRSIGIVRNLDGIP